MFSSEDISQQQELLATYRRSLSIYLKQLAQQGSAFALPSLLHSIIEARDNISRIKKNIQDSGSAAEDWLIDTYPTIDPVVLQQDISNISDLKIIGVEEEIEVVDISLIDDPSELRKFRVHWFPKTAEQTQAYTERMQEFIEMTEKHPMASDIKHWMIDRIEHDLFLKDGNFPIIDIKLRNLSKETLFLKQLEFKVVRRELIVGENIYMCNPMRPTWEYNVLLDARKDHSTSKLEISQIIRPGDVDRFIVIVGFDNGGSDFLSVSFDAEVILFYNKNQFINLGVLSIKIKGEVAISYEKLLEVKKVEEGEFNPFANAVPNTKTQSAQEMQQIITDFSKESDTIENRDTYNEIPKGKPWWKRWFRR